MASTTIELQPQAADAQQSDEALAPPTAVGVVEKWNEPRSNIYRTFATFWSFLVMGANDAAYGVSICHRFQRHS